MPGMPVSYLILLFPLFTHQLHCNSVFFIHDRLISGMIILFLSDIYLCGKFRLSFWPVLMLSDPLFTYQLPVCRFTYTFQQHIKSLLTVSWSEYIYSGYKMFFYSNS